jgi:hypothetical protein
MSFRVNSTPAGRPLAQEGDGRKGHPNPFLLYSNESFPTEYRASLDFCAYLYNLTGQYAEASRRVVSHFITDVDFVEKRGSPEEQEDWRRFLVEELNCFQAMQNLGDDWSAYGVGYVRIHYPFDRLLQDKRVPGKPKAYNINKFPRELIKYLPEKMEFEVPDPAEVAAGKSFKEATRVSFPFTDLFTRKREGISLVPLDPRYCRVNYGTMSKKTEVIYQFDPEFRTAIEQGDIFEVLNTPKLMLQAIAQKADFRFKEGQVFIFTRPSLTGISKKGLGIPNPIAHYRELHQLQVYRKIDETLARDYMVPIRIMSPGFGSSGGPIDPAFAQNSTQWLGKMGQLISKWRNEQDTLFAVPYPTQYQELSGNGKNLVPKELMALQMDSLLNSVGYPAELFKGTLQYQQFPIAVRIFERSFHFIYHNFNQFLKWVTQNTRRFLQLPEIGVELQPANMADDESRRQIAMELVAGGEVPRELLFKMFGMRDPAEAFRQRAQEDILFEEIRAESAEEMQRRIEADNLQAAHQASMPPPQGAQGGAPPPPGGGGVGGATPLSVQNDLMAQAQQKAAQWLEMPEGDRFRDMQNTKASNQALHAMAKEFMEKARSRGASEGRQQAAQFV